MIYQGHELVTEGLNRMIRHPSYLGLLLGLFGWALAFRSEPGVLVSLLMIPKLVARMNSEEALLASVFGEQYSAEFHPEALLGASEARRRYAPVPKR
jgi:protein-S-isoprenylcysteine O-methyltransferase Ste14